MSAPPEGYTHYSHPPMSSQTLMEEASETSLPNSSSLSDRRNAPGPLTKPKDRKMVGLAVVSLYDLVMMHIEQCSQVHLPTGPACSTGHTRHLVGTTIIAFLSVSIIVLCN